MRWLVAAALIGFSIVQPETIILTVPALIALAGVGSADKKTKAK
jgi:hypothetical protein